MADLDAKRLLETLAHHQVQFVLIGGLAMIAQGSTYVTKYLDLCYERSENNLDRVVQALGEFHPYLRGVPAGLPFHWDRRTLQAGLNFTLTTDAGDLDLLGEVPGLGRFDQVLVQSEPKQVFGLTLQVLSLEGLIAAKTAAGRLKDKLHLLELEELKKLREGFAP